MNEKFRVTNIEIERYVLGELPDDRRKTIEAAMKADPTLAAEISAVETSNEAVLAEYPPHLMAVQIEEKARSAGEAATSKKRYMMPVLSAVTAAAAALVVMVLLPHENISTHTGAGYADEGLETTRLKGIDPDKPSLFVYRHGKDGEERLTKGTVASAGDLVQLKYSGKGQRHGVIFSVDGRGTVTLHYPLSRGDNTALKKGVHTLQSSYELDDAPAFERFFFVTSNRPIDVTSVLEKARSVGESGRLSLSKEYRTNDFVLKKK